MGWNKKNNGTCVPFGVRKDMKEVSLRGLQTMAFWVENVKQKVKLKSQTKIGRNKMWILY